jgi:hypothetical protein
MAMRQRLGSLINAFGPIVLVSKYVSVTWIHAYISISALMFNRVGVSATAKTNGSMCGEWERAKPLPRVLSWFISKVERSSSLVSERAMCPSKRIDTI